MIEIQNFHATGEKSNKQSELENPLGVWGGEALENFWDYTLSTFNSRLFPTTSRGLEKDHICTYNT